ncbi:hypothetical protein AHAS_Ahas18G0184800 [Arachis hypogaea]
MMLATFLKIHPLTFGGTTNPTEANNWFQGDATIPRNAFRTEFYKKYFPDSVKMAKKLELLQLKQGQMTVAEYTNMFEELCRFSRICQGASGNFEEWKCIKYEGGLQSDILSSMGPMEIRIFSDLVVHKTGSTEFAQINRQVYRVVQVIAQVSEGQSYGDCWFEQAVVTLQILVRRIEIIVCHGKYKK